MNIKEVKQLQDKTPVASVTGLVEKQYPPDDQTDNDKRFSQHRQAILISDDTGEKLMVVLMKQSLHILDAIEGKQFTITAGRNEKGELRGILQNRWTPPNSKFDKVTVRIYPEATMQVTDRKAPAVATESKAPAPAPAPTPAPATGECQFEKTLELTSYGYGLCLDRAESLLASRPALQGDPESLRAVATNLWMNVKHHAPSLTPPVANSQQSRDLKAAAVNREDDAARHAIQETRDQELAKRLLKGWTMREDGKLSASQIGALDQLTDKADQRGGVWEKAYDELIVSFKEGPAFEDPYDVIQEACNNVYDQIVLTQEVSPGKRERACVTAPLTFKERVNEELSRIAGDI